MDTTMIQELLDRYWNGDTTLEEERMLKAFFAQTSVPEQFQRDAQWFRALQVERAVQMERHPIQVAGAGRFKRITWAAAAAIALLAVGSWLWSIKHQAGTPLPVATLVKPPLATPETKPVAGEQMQTAALPAPVKIKHRRKCKVVPAPADTYDDPEKAMAEIRAALSLVSSKINKSRREAEKGLLEMDNVEILLKKKNING